LALTDREAFDAVVLADDLAVGRDDLTRKVEQVHVRTALHPTAAADKIGVIARGDKADLLAVLLVGNPQAEPPGSLADFVLAKFADGEHQPRENFTPDAEEDV